MQLRPAGELMVLDHPRREQTHGALSGSHHEGSHAVAETLIVEAGCRCAPNDNPHHGRSSLRAGTSGCCAHPEVANISTRSAMR